MKKIWLSTIAVSLSMFLAPVSANDIADKCDTCHGKNGNSEDGKVPSIAGFSAPFISDTLNAYKEGDRTGKKYKPENGDETDMNEVAKKLSDDDIENIANHYAAQEFIVHKQEHNAKMAKKGKKKFKKKCDKCHSDGGSNPDDDAGLLLGQWRPYLEAEFKAFTEKERLMPKKMKKKFKKLSEKDKKNIIEYLVSGEM